MGNCLKRSCLVHPTSGDGGGRSVAGEKKIDLPLRIKVRMRRDKLEELLYLEHGDELNGGDCSKIGFLILKESMEDRLPVTTVLASGDDDDVRYGRSCLVSQRLSSIKEE